MNDSAALHKRAVFAEDLEIGQVIPLGSYSVTEEEIVEFATQWDPQWFHVDKEAAESGVFGGLIASGLHTLSICQKLVVASLYDQWNVIAGKAMRDVSFLRPLRPGDTLSGKVTVDNVVFDNRARGLVTITAKLVDAHGNRVLDVVTDAYLHCRSTRGQ
ncbi:MaoC family dehydratase N-terminal domain-containing protein [Rhodococcus qingshengii]|uniref:MaoC/PaaZ C-terminal domain-containing protein n=1 Tax=Rhodococcus qingshengii TaxID=334542 RepID=UPI001AEFD135|nr:MaoC/PaaZ C-terminal domain-containing protein [Rhodococcus qingshengii]QTS02126.1 MaoC family dehydratase N-terminal domain-containing protein [Rhodococcus qingshengii]